jgi:hypothetical protein
MAPPTASEQLIRDYLNRLSVAARDLTPDDRRALLERTRSLIDQKADLAGRPSTMDVGRVLSRLGDPARLVEQERRRLAAQGGSSRTATSATSATPARQRFLARALGREHGRSHGPSFGWPVQSDSRTSAPVAPSNGIANGVHHPDAPAESGGRDAAAADVGLAAELAAHAEPSPAALAPPAPSPSASATASADRPAGAGKPADTGSPLPADPLPAANGAVNLTAAAGAEPPRPARSSVAPRRTGPGPGAGEKRADPAPSAAGTERDARQTVSAAEASATGGMGSAGASATEADATAAGSGRDEAEADATAVGSGRDEAEARPQPGRWRHPRGAALRGPASRQVSRLLVWVRKHPLEAAAIVLLGIGGPIFPPVFLIGATLALASELWDGRDKWVGLALPIVLTVIGLAVGVAAGGRAHWMHEGWVYLDVFSRVAPALGAGYLAWRSRRPPRPSPLPPFSRPYRAS